MATRQYEGQKYQRAEKASAWDPLTVEAPLQININGEAFTVSMRTPGDDLSLTRGMLHSEDIIKSADFQPKIVLEKESKTGIISVVNVDIPEKELGRSYTNSRTLLSVSSCGICGKTSLGDMAFMGSTLNHTDSISVDLVGRLFKTMHANQHQFKASGGAHAASVFSIEGQLLTTKEDIGRHNAVDKAIGDLIRKNSLEQARILTVSGRVSYEIVIKCFKAKIPVLAAVSAPSTLAVDYAKELGITLLGFCRAQRFTCYANPYRIQDSSSQNQNAG